MGQHPLSRTAGALELFEVAARTPQRMIRIRDFLSSLAAATTVVEVADAVVTDGLVALGATAGALLTVNFRLELELVAAEGLDPAELARLSSIALDAEDAVAR